LVGFGVGGAHVSFTLFAEFLPGNNRGIFLCIIEIFWCAGSIIESLLAMLIFPNLGNHVGWRWLLGISSLPFLIGLLLFPFITESFRFLMLSGQEEKAYAVLERAGAMNKRPLPPTTIVVVKKSERGQLKDLVRPGIRRTSTLLWLIWFANAFVYYGLVLLVTELFNQENAGIRCSSHPISNTTMPEGSCKPLVKSDYIGVLITSSAELPGIIFTILIIDRLGRKKTIVIELVGTALCAIALIFCWGRKMETIILSIARAFITGAFQAVYVYTPEAYPTSIRSTAVGLCSAVGRTGGITTPFIAQVLVRFSAFMGLVVYAAVSLLAAIASLFLVETSGRNMNEKEYNTNIVNVELVELNLQESDDGVQLQSQEDVESEKDI